MPRSSTPLEAWFVWGLSHELVGHPELARIVFVLYLHKRGGLPIERACRYAQEMRATENETNRLLNGIVDAGRRAVREGGDGYFTLAAKATRRLIKAAG